MCAEATMKSAVTMTLLVAAVWLTSACVRTDDKAGTTEKSLVAVKLIVSEKTLVAGGTIKLQLDVGSYELRAAADNNIRVSLNRNGGDAKVELTVDGTHAGVRVKDTQSHFQATIDVPQAADLVVRFSGGDLVMAPITGNKDIESYAGDIKIAVGDPNDYSSVDASVKAGDLKAGPFGETKSGLLQHFTWSGPGKYTLRANLGAGDLVLRSK